MTTDNAEKSPRLAGPTAAGKVVGLSQKRVRTLMKAGRITMVRLPGSRVLVDVDELREIISASTTPGLFGNLGTG